MNSSAPNPMSGMPGTPSPAAAQPAPEEAKPWQAPAATTTEAPATEAPEVETEDVEDEPVDHSVEDIYAENYSRSELFSMRDLAAALDFQQRWIAAPVRTRDTFLDLMQIDSDSNSMDVVSGLYPSSGRLSSVEFIANVHEKNNSESMSRADIRAWGMEFASTVTAMDPEEIRVIAKMLNFLTPDDYAELRYRRNMAAMDVINMLSDAVDAIDDERLATLKWTSDMLAIWPGQTQ